MNQTWTGLLEPSAVRAVNVPKQVPVMDDATVAALRQLGRTEDLMFSPSGHMLAVVGHLANEILLLKVEVKPQACGTVSIHLNAPCSLKSSHLAYPHGISWLTDRICVVANRQGKACVFRLPTDMSDESIHLEPELVLGADLASPVQTPGSVSARRLAPDCWEVILCNNYSHELSQHLIELSPSIRSVAESTLIRRDLSIPDGVAQSPDGRWMAVSNHNEHAVRLYRDRPDLAKNDHPDVRLRGVNFPHGLRFTSCGRYLLVADAGLPFVHIYGCDDGDWYRAATLPQSIRVVDDQLYWRGRHNPQEGGPKGIDFVPGHNVLAVTNHEQPLAFFDLNSVLKSGSTASPLLGGHDSRVVSLRRHVNAQANQLLAARQEASMLTADLNGALARVSELRQVQQTLEERDQAQRVVTEDLADKLDRCQRELNAVRASRSWRATAPCRMVGSWVRHCFAAVSRRPAATT